MGTKNPDKVLADWKLEKITPEQAIGYILQNMIRLERELHDLNSSIYQIIKRTGSDTTKKPT